MSFEIKTIDNFDRQAHRLAKHYPSFREEHHHRQGNQAFEESFAIITQAFKLSKKNYFQATKINFQAMKIYFRGLEIYFHGFVLFLWGNIRIFAFR